ncbi:MAG: MFS transporter [Acidimicrobiia bacterium]
MPAAALIRLCRLDRLPRRAGVDDRAVAVAFTARFVDEALSGAWTVLTPTFRRVFDLSLLQVGLALQLLEWVALAVEPAAATSVDLVSRRRLIAVGGVAVAASVAIMGLAPTFPVLLVGFALYGIGSGPLAHTADIVVVEAFPDDPERAYGRATMLDTVGALLGPAAVAGAAAAGLSWRVVLVALAGVAAVHAYAASTASFPPPPRTREPGDRLGRAIVGGIRLAAADARIRRALLVLLAFDLFESAFVLKYVWLHDQVGLSEAAVALWAVVEQVVGLVALLALDGWLQRHPGRRILGLAAAALLVLPGAWVLAPGVGGRIAVGVPLAFAAALVWPIAKFQLLVVEPTLSGATQAATTLFPLVPLALLQAAAASRFGTGPAMATTATVAALLLVALVRRPELPAP